MNKKDKNGLKQGYWEEDHFHYKYKGYYIDDLKDGEWSFFVINYNYETLSSIENYEKGDPHGIHTYFNKDGSIGYIESYKNGLYHGTSLTYYKDGGGVLVKYNYEYDEQVGIEIYYKIDGTHDYINFYL